MAAAAWDPPPDRSLAVLFIEGQLRGQDRTQTSALGDRLLDMDERGCNEVGCCYGATLARSSAGCPSISVVTARV
jgi:hypothetical protein